MMKPVTIAALILLGLALVGGAASASERKNCRNCPAPRPHYDSQEVVKTSRDIDHSRVIETQSVVPVKRRLVTKNHLVVHDRQVRHVGVVRHRHTIIEKEVRYIRRAPPLTQVNYVVHDYRAVRRPWSGAGLPPLHRAEPRSIDCVYGKDGRCTDVPLDVRG
jgi:hypothetical protein